MHMADALVSAPVAIAAGVVAATLIIIASNKVKTETRQDIVPLMGVMGAFIFAAQMINFSIPGTGASGHIVGGILLASILGPWAAFITLSSVIIIQCLVFADGGLMALGCNLINMGAISCLIAYPFIYKIIIGNSSGKGRIMVASIASSTIALLIGALLVTFETELSGITALPFNKFLLFMMPIHLAIGICEGIATGLIICFIKAYKPEMLFSESLTLNTDTDSSGYTYKKHAKSTKIFMLIIFIVTLILAGSFTWIASSSPDGLEWSIEKLVGSNDMGNYIVSPTAVMPDYNSSFAGLIGGVIVILVIWGLSAIIFRKRNVKA